MNLCINLLKLFFILDNLLFIYLRSFSFYAACGCAAWMPCASPLLHHLFNINTSICTPFLCPFLHLLKLGDQHQLLLIRFLQVERFFTLCHHFPFGLLPFLKDAVLEIALFFASCDRILAVDRTFQRGNLSWIAFSFQGIFKGFAFGF